MAPLFFAKFTESIMERQSCWSAARQKSGSEVRILMPLFLFFAEFTSALMEDETL